MFPILSSDNVSKQALPEGGKPTAAQTADLPGDGFLSEFAPAEGGTIAPVMWQVVRAAPSAGVPVFVYTHFPTPSEEAPDGETAGEPALSAPVNDEISAPFLPPSHDMDTPSSPPQDTPVIPDGDGAAVLSGLIYPQAVRVVNADKVNTPESVAPNRTHPALDTAGMAHIQPKSGRATVPERPVAETGAATPIDKGTDTIANMSPKIGHGANNTMPNNILPRGEARSEPAVEGSDRAPKSWDNEKLIAPLTKPAQSLATAAHVTAASATERVEADAKIAAPPTIPPRQQMLRADESGQVPAPPPILEQTSPELPLNRTTQEAAVMPRHTEVRTEQGVAPAKPPLQHSAGALEQAADHTQFPVVRGKSLLAAEGLMQPDAQDPLPTGDWRASVQTEVAAPRIPPDRAAPLSEPALAGVRVARAETQPAEAAPGTVPTVPSEDLREVSIDEKIKINSLAAPPPMPSTISATPTQGLTAVTQHPQLGASVAAQVSVAISEMDTGQIEISLSPEELGKVRLTLHSMDSGLTVGLHADRPETLDLMRRHVHLLARDLADLGYESVTFDFGGAQSDQNSFFDAPHPTETPDRDDIVTSEPAEQPLTPQPLTLRMAPESGLDIRI